jgi:hypothetical protein
MLSELIFSAEKHVANRFLLVNAISTATREFHRPGTRVQETVNDVLVRFGRAEPIASVEFVQRTPGRFGTSEKITCLLDSRRIVGVRTDTGQSTRWAAGCAHASEGIAEHWTLTWQVSAMRGQR